MKNISDKSVEKIETHCIFSKFPPPTENRAVYEVMWKNIIERGKTQMTIWRMNVAYWIPKATNTHDCKNANQGYAIRTLYFNLLQLLSQS
jgi:hypothetical protein